AHSRSCGTLFYFVHLPAPSRASPLSLHDALPILAGAYFALGLFMLAMGVGILFMEPRSVTAATGASSTTSTVVTSTAHAATPIRSEEHTSELQSRENLVCRLLLEKKNKIAARREL